MCIDPIEWKTSILIQWQFKFLNIHSWLLFHCFELTSLLVLLFDFSPFIILRGRWILLIFAKSYRLIYIHHIAVAFLCRAWFRWSHRLILSRLVIHRLIIIIIVIMCKLTLRIKITCIHWFLLYNLFRLSVAHINISIGWLWLWNFL